MIDALYAAFLTLGVGISLVLAAKALRSLLVWATADLLRD